MHDVAWRGMWICVRSKDAQKQLARTSLKCYVKPMEDPLGVSPSKGIRGPHKVKKNSFDLGGNRTYDLRIRSTVTLPTELRGRTEKVGTI